MRILALTNLYPVPLQPGRGPFNRQHFRALAERQPVAVIAPVSWTEEVCDRWRHPGGWPRDRCTRCDGIPVVHPRYLFPPKILRGWYGPFFRWSVRRAFQHALKRFRPDVVFAPWAYPDGWAAVELGHRAGLPVVIKVHGSDVLALPDYPARRRRTVEALCRADGVIAVSRDLRERAIALGADPFRVRVVYDGINVQHFRPGSGSVARRRLGLVADIPLLLFVGRLHPVKGLDVLVEACARLMKEGLHFHSFLIGEGPERAKLDRLVARHGLQERVCLPGWVPHDRLPDWYRAASAFVLPSHSEGVPNVLLEAAACGTPFVASRVGGIPEIAHLGPAELVSPDDASALAAALLPWITGAAPPAGIYPPPRGIADVADELEQVFEQIIDRHHTVDLAGPPERAGAQAASLAFALEERPW